MKYWILANWPGMLGWSCCWLRSALSAVQNDPVQCGWASCASPLFDSTASSASGCAQKQSAHWRDENSNTTDAWHTTHFHVTYTKLSAITRNHQPLMILREGIFTQNTHLNMMVHTKNLLYSTPHQQRTPPTGQCECHTTKTSQNKSMFTWCNRKGPNAHSVARQVNFFWLCSFPDTLLQCSTAHSVPASCSIRGCRILVSLPWYHTLNPLLQPHPAWLPIFPSTHWNKPIQQRMDPTIHKTQRIPWNQTPRKNPKSSTQSDIIWWNKTEQYNIWHLIVALC